MNIKKEILLAFLIPLIAAITLVLLAFLFQAECQNTYSENGKTICFDERNNSPIASEEFILFIFGLIILSVVLPFYVDWSIKKNRNYKVKQILKIENGNY